MVPVASSGNTFFYLGFLDFSVLFQTQMRKKSHQTLTAHNDFTAFFFIIDYINAIGAGNTTKNLGGDKLFHPDGSLCRTRSECDLGPGTRY